MLVFTQTACKLGSKRWRGWGGGLGTVGKRSDAFMKHVCYCGLGYLRVA